MLGNKYVAFLVDLLHSCLRGQFAPLKSLVRGNVQRPVRSEVLRSRAERFLCELKRCEKRERALANELGARLSVVDVLLMIGGGYINCLWSSRVYPQLMTLALAKSLGKPLILSGQTIGPLDDFDLGLVRDALACVDLIGVRDVGISAAILRDIVQYEGAIIESTDDALFMDRVRDQAVYDVLGKLACAMNQLRLS